MRYPDYYVPCKYCSDPNEEWNWPGRYKHDPKYPSCFNCRDKVGKEEPEEIDKENKQVPSLLDSSNSKEVNKEPEPKNEPESSLIGNG